MLIALFNANPHSKLGWNLNDDIQDWEGVELDEKGNIVELWIGEKGLSTILPSIGTLVHLRRLDLSGGDPVLGEPNALAGTLTSVPSEIGKLVQLQRLDLSHNQLTSVPSEIGGLVHLSALFLGVNNLSSIPKAICDLEKNGTELFADINCQ